MTKCNEFMKRINYFIILMLATFSIQAKVYNCMDSQGQRVFSDKPCVETTVGEGVVSNYEGSNLAVQKIPTVLDANTANKIRYRISPAEIKKKYCAKYSEVDRGRLVQARQVLLGMYLADVIKVWGAPIASDGNRILFKDNEDTVTVSLLEGCVINISRDYLTEDEFFNPEIYEPIDDQLDY